ncbi:NAD-dependent epimerase/dehydratase family protein [Agrococcus versicolor]|uniref:NAD-dependent epimerase/dehydratase family protein n=1 Tax=Agrococcus versicolor TaxID=501482 RepID=A0ABP5MUP2_9MICO
MSAATTVLVTGGAGFIGSHVVEAALARGWRVRVLDSLRADVHGDGTMRVPAQDGLEMVVADLADEDAVAGALEGVDVVCHLAAKVGLGVDFADAADYVTSNVTGTATLLQAMRVAGVRRLVLASSMVVYGEGAYRDAEGPLAVPPRLVADLEAGRFEPVSPRTGEPVEPLLVDESAPSDPRNVYAASKLAQEHLAAAWARGGDGSAASLRFHNVYGPHMPMGTPYAGVASIFRSSLERGEAPRVFEDGGQRRDFVHVRDVADANLAAADWTFEQPVGASRAFNVGSGTVHTIGEMATALADAFGGPAPVVTGDYRLGDVRHVTASSSRAADELGWRARIGFAEGMEEFAHAPQRPPAGRDGSRA